MLRTIGQLIYMAKHLLWVWAYCVQQGIIRRAIKHDWSKFRRDEWSGFASSRFDRLGRWVDPMRITPEFLEARRLHHERNDHHWEHWVFTGRDGKIKTLNMPLNARKEMLADWRAAARVQGGNIRQWYQQNRDSVHLNPKTRAWVEEQLSI